MTTFQDLPKQWLVAREIPEAAGGIDHGAFHGWHIRTAARVPVLTVRDVQGGDVARVIGWAIDGNRFFREDSNLNLGDGETPDDLYRRMGGRFVMIWQDPTGHLVLREDASGNLPAIYTSEIPAIGSTVTALEMLAPLPEDADAIALFEFPKRRGFLPFGITPRRGAFRLMPNHVLDLETFSSRRVWPTPDYCRREEMSESDCKALAASCGKIVRENLTALLTQGETVLYLSGGHDSRMILAAAEGLPGTLRYETLGTKGGLDIHIAQKLARQTGHAHQTIHVEPSSSDEIAAWVQRAGGMMFDAVSMAASTMQKHTPLNHPLSGTGAELARGTNWQAEDLTAQGVALDTLLYRLRIPDTPRIRTAAQAWLDNIPPEADGAMILDLAKIEQIHGCWAGAAIYGHPMVLPSLHPFSGHRLTEIILSMPRDYRFAGKFYRDYVAAMAPWMLDIPVNQAKGLHRLRFWKHELREAIPTSVKRWLKPFR